MNDARTLKSGGDGVDFRFSKKIKGELQKRSRNAITIVGQSECGHAQVEGKKSGGPSKRPLLPNTTGSTPRDVSQIKLLIGIPKCVRQ